MTKETQTGKSNITDAVEQALTYLDVRYVVTVHGGKALVFDRLKAEFFKPGEWSQVDRFPQITVPRPRGEPKIVDKRKFWLTSDRRTEKPEGVVFEPGKKPEETPKHLNVWQGWGCKAAPGTCTRWLNHILDVICQGDAGDYAYLMDVLAYGVQKPSKPLPVAIVIRGAQGSGKTTLSTAMARIYSERHTFTFADPAMLTGQFNGHLLGKQLLCVEEAFFHGDRKDIGKLKHLITAPDMTIHQKGLTPFLVPNMLRIIVTTNHDHVLHLDSDDRRWLVLETDDTYAKDKAYFRDLYAELESGGYEAFFQTLLNRDLSEFNPFAEPPITKAKLHQTAMSIDGIDAWYLSCLSRGYIGVADGPVYAGKKQWEKDAVTVENQDVLHSHNAYARENNGYALIGSHKITKALRRFGVTKSRDSDGKRLFQFPQKSSAIDKFCSVFGVSDLSGLE